MTFFLECGAFPPLFFLWLFKEKQEKKRRKSAALQKRTSCHETHVTYFHLSDPLADQNITRRRCRRRQAGPGRFTISRFTGTPPSVKRVKRVKRSRCCETLRRCRETIVKRLLHR